MPDLSVVIPTLNEEQHLPHLLDDLSRQQSIQLEVVVADGGSSDTTRSVAEQYSARVVESAAGRGRQMNAGARAASASMLLFVHADSRIPDPRQLEQALRVLGWCSRQTGGGMVAGHFSLRFIGSAADRRAFRFLEAKTRLNREQTISGDQGLLLLRRSFEELGGFDESLPFLEDQRLAELIWRSATWLLLPGVIETSARRFAREGITERMILNMLIMALFSLGENRCLAGIHSLYREQSVTGPPDLARVFRRLNRELHRRPALEWPTLWTRVGRYAAANLWQLNLAGGGPRYGTFSADSYHGRHWTGTTLHRFSRSALAAMFGAFVSLVWFYGAWARYEIRRLMRGETAPRP
ncbi:MAG: TIGR04283 family arsenosugar biosynthesis glycosyltransferase [Bdellovibrionales bacterium]|nr:TIGR04283 family arsenosugar biosynthesis glycosyltransferase [Bdellovibrionales bacterium]